LDDNLTVNREYARELFTAMIPLKKRWFSQCNVRIAYDGDLVDLAYNSGCRGLFIGLESLNQENLTSWGKHFGKTNEYRWAMDKIHRAGIGIISGIVFGHDGDTDSIFSETLQFLHDADIDALQATILTPFPGTPLFAEMERSHRIRSTDWGLYDFSNVVFEPLQMSAEALKAGHDRVLREFYSWRSVVRRTFRELAYLDPSTILHASLPLNLSYRARLHADGII
jgi:radical SAM superfamily enzyme YgiQ (UPF0313 family)